MAFVAGYAIFGNSLVRWNGKYLRLSTGSPSGRSILRIPVPLISLAFVLGETWNFRFAHCAMSHLIFSVAMHHTWLRMFSSSLLGAVVFSGFLRSPAVWPFRCIFSPLYFYMGYLNMRGSCLDVRPSLFLCLGLKF